MSEKKNLSQKFGNDRILELKQAKEKLAQKRAIEVVQFYGGANLARKLGIKHQAVSKWQKAKIPPFRAMQISNLDDFELEWIRPDISFRP